MQKASRKWLYLRAHKPGDEDGRFHTLRIDVIEPRGDGIANAKVIQEGIFEMADADSDIVAERIRHFYPGEEVQEDFLMNYVALGSPYLAFRVSKTAEAEIMARRAA